MQKRILKRLVVGLGSVGVLAAAFLGGRAFAAGIPADDVLSYSGTILALDGTPVEGEHDIEVQFSTSSIGSSLLCTTTVNDVDVVLGRFTIPLNPLCVMDVQTNPKLYVQVVVDAEGFGWSPIGAVPYAVEAGHATRADEANRATVADDADRATAADGADSATGPLDTRIADLEADVAALVGVPSGAVMAFDRTSCPQGWTALANAAGRTIVGLPSGGTLQGIVGNTPLANLEDRAHTHDVDPASATSSPAGAHAHTVDPPNTTSTTVDLSHTHSVNPSAFTLPAHRHTWATFHGTTLIWNTYNSGGGNLELVTWGNGMTNDGSGNYPLEHATNVSTGLNTYYTSAEVSALSVDVPSTTSSAASASMSHSHSVDLPSTSSNTAADHTHTVNVASTTSSSATTSLVMPYIQLLYCVKS